MAENFIRVKQINQAELSGYIVAVGGTASTFVSYTGDNLVYSTGDQTISGIKTFSDYIQLTNQNDGIRFNNNGSSYSTNVVGNESGITLKTFQQPTDIVIRSDFVGGNIDEVISIRNTNTSNRFGQSINGLYDSIVIYNTGSTYGIPSSNGPYLRLGDNNIISEKSTSKLGIGTLFPSEKVHISGGNLRVQGNAIANNLVYNTGDQTISGIKIFATGIFAPNLIYNTGDQTINGLKTFSSGISVTGGIALQTFGYPPIKTEIISQNFTDASQFTKEVIAINMNYGVDTDGLFGQDINTFGYGGDKIVFYQTGSVGGVPFSVGPYLRLGYNNIISEKPQSRLGIGTLFPTEKVHISGGNLRVQGNAIANNLVYNTGDQTISGVKTFNDNIIIKSGAIITGMNYFWFNTGTGGSVTNSDNTITSFYLESGVAYRLESHLTFVAGTNANSISDLNKNPVNFADAIGFRQGSNNSSDLRDAPLSGYLQLGYSSSNGSIWGSISGRTNHIRKGIIRPTGGNGTITFTYGSHNGSNARLTENYILIEKIARI